MNEPAGPRPVPATPGTNPAPAWPWLLATLLGAAVLAWVCAQPPAPRPATAPPTAFSAERAMVDVRALASAPRPAGSPASARARAYLTRRLERLGFAVHESVAVLPPGARRHPGDPHPQAALTLVTLVGVRPAGAPGSRSGAGPAVALMAHHDSVPGSPGAADDAFGVASALEVARAIPHTAQRRDLVVLFTDGEEAGLLGARAFFTPGDSPAAVAAPDPLARRIGVVLNLEARGGGGRAQMFETSPQNGALMRLYAQHVRHPSATSLATSIYRRLPNGTDFTPALAAGVMGLNFSPLGRARLYHSPLATPEAVDPGTVQHLGDQALDMTRALLTEAHLPAPAPDAVFGDVLGWQTLVYPAWAGWLGVGGAAGLLALAAVRRRAAWNGTSALRAGGAALGLTLLAGGLLTAANALSLAPGPANYYDRLAALPRLETQALLVVLAVLALATAGRGANGSRALGPVAAGLLLAGAVQAFFPLGGPPFLWPVALAAVALALAWGLNLGPRGQHAVAAGAAVVGLAQTATLAHALLLAIGPRAPGVIAPLLLPALSLLAPLLPSAPRRTAFGLALALLLAAGGVALWVRLDAPAPSIPAYVDGK